MIILAKYGLTLIHAAVATFVVGSAGLANYYGFAFFGESAEKVQPGFQPHSYVHYHK